MTQTRPRRGCALIWRLACLAAGLWACLPMTAWAGGDAPRSLVYMMGGPSETALATGLNLLLDERINDTREGRAVPRLDAQQAAARAKVLRPGGRIYVRDLGMLALALEAKHVVLGELEQRSRGVSLVLRAYDAQTGLNAASVRIDEAADGTRGFVERAEKALAPMLGLSDSVAWPKRGEALNWPALARLGRGFNALPTDALGGLLEMQRAATEGVGVPGLARAWLNDDRLPLEKPVALDAPLRALVQDLAGDKAAVKAYEGLLRGATGKRLAVAYATRLLEDRQGAKVKSLLEGISHTETHSGPVFAALAEAYRQAGNKAAAAEAARTARSLGEPPAPLYEIEAQQAAAAGKRKEAAALYAQSAMAEWRAGLAAGAAQKALAWLGQTPSDELLGALPIEALDENARGRVESLIKGQGFSEAARSVAKARLLAAANQLDEAAPLFAKAGEGDDTPLGQALAAASFFLVTKPNFDPAIRYFEAGAKVAPTDPVVQAGLADAYQQGELFDKALDTVRVIEKDAPNSPYWRRREAELLLSLKNVPEARSHLDAVLKDNEDDAEALLLSGRIAKAANDAAAEKNATQRAYALDVSLAPAKEKAVEKPEAKPENKPAPAKPAPAPDAAKPLQVADTTRFPATPALLASLNDGVKRLALVNLNRVSRWTGHAGFVARLTEPFLLDAAPLGADIAKALEGLVVIADDASLAGEVELLDNVNPFGANSFNKVLAKSQADAVLLYGVVPAKGKSGLVAVSYFYSPKKMDLPNANAEIATHLEEFSHFNPVILVWLLVVAAAAAGVWMLLKRRGFGALTLTLRFDETFEDGYFAARLSKRPLKQAFNIEPLMNKKYEGTRADTERKVQAFFRSLSPYRRMARRNVITFERVPQGHYYVYLTGLMVNLETRVPIGNYEMQREADVVRDQAVQLELDLSITESFVELHVTKETIRKRQVRQKVEGKLQSVEKETKMIEEVPGVSVEVVGHPEWSKQSEGTKRLSFDLPLGVYRLIASAEDLAAVVDIVVDDNAPRTLELRLRPRAELQAELAAPLPEPSPELYARIEAQRAKAALPEVSAVAPHVDHTVQLEQEVIEDVIKVEAAKPVTMVVGTPNAAPAAKPAAKPAVVVKAPPAPVRPPRPALLEEEDDGLLDGDLELLAASLSQPDSSPFGEAPVLSEIERVQALDAASKLNLAGHYEQAAELYLRLGEYDKAVEMGQRTSTPELTYKIYGINYLRQNNFREAVEMFKLAGEKLLEAQALDGMRSSDEANRLRGDYWESQGDLTQAVECYTKAKAYDKIAQLCERQHDFSAAGESYLKARQPSKAADAFLKARDPKRAAQVYESDGQYMRAADLYRQMGGGAKMYSMYERAGRYCEAAEGYKRHGLGNEAIHACQQVRPESGDFLKAALIMGTIFVERSELGLARGVYAGAIERVVFSPEKPEAAYEFAVLIHQQDMLEEARTMFEKIEAAHPGYGDVAIRLAQIRQRLESEKVQRETNVPRPAPVPAFPAFDPAKEEPEPASITPPSNRYVFEQELGRGAMGIVYRARDTLLDRVVAYKTVSGAIKDNPEALRYFLSEAKSLAALNHPNIVTVYDVGQENNTYYLTMEYVDGRSLADFIRERGKLSLKNCVAITLKLCAGLDYAHSRGVVHRDIKPSNVMLSNQGEVKLMDFGLAKIVGDAIPDASVVRGTPLYMSPEQASGADVDAQSDLYSFGVTLYEMACGVPPFTKGDIAKQHLTVTPAKPSLLNPSIPEVLERVIMKCLAKDKRLRYASAKDIRTDIAPLRHALVGAPKA